MSLLEVKNLTTRIVTDDGVLTCSNGISFEVEESEMVGIVGESGSGKTMTALSIMDLVEYPAQIETGKVLFKGEDLLSKPDSELRRLRGSELSMVFQDPSASLNPVYTVGFQIARVIRRHKGIQAAPQHQRLLNRTLGMDIHDAARDEAIDLMRRVKIPDAAKRYGDYPHEFSGGMRQRALIAMGLAGNPDLLIADEITTGLDVTTQSEIFDLLKQLRDELNMSIILITHDLATVAETCDRLLVMYAGNIVESGAVSEVFSNPYHPYTAGLLKSVPRIGRKVDQLQAIDGSPPDLLELPTGCNFHPRCPFADQECRASEPPLEQKAPERRAACFKTESVRQDAQQSEEYPQGRA